MPPREQLPDVITVNASVVGRLAVPIPRLSDVLASLYRKQPDLFSSPDYSDEAQEAIEQ